MDDSPASTNLTFGALTGVTATTATSTASLTSLPGLTVTHTVQPATAAPNALFRVHVKITNATGATVTNLKYVRVMDWDVPPTEFSELVTIVGVGTTTLLERSHDDGFATANPLVDSTGATGTNNTDFIRNGPADHGAYFRFNFGSLADGASYEFDIYYGAAASQAAAVSAITSEAIELYTLGQSNGPADGTPATYIFGFKGVGGVPVGPPVPAGPVEIPTQSEWMLALMALLLAATAGFALKRR
jgi:type IV pilus assembly protein PilY1